MASSLAGVVLAAGASPWQGRARALKPVPGGHGTAVEHVASVLEQRCRPVFVVATLGQSLPALSAEVVRDEVRGHGQLSAIGRGLRAAAEAGATHAFLASVDATILSVDVIDILLAQAERVRADIVLPWDGDNHYLAAVYRTQLASVAEDLVAAGERDISALINRVDSHRVVFGAAGVSLDDGPTSDAGVLSHA